MTKSSNKSPRLFAIACALGAATAWGAETPLSRQAADADWQKTVEAHKRAFSSSGRPGLTPNERVLEYSDGLTRLNETYLQFYRAHPDDPRHWEAAINFLGEPNFLKAVKPEYAERPTAENKVVDEVARAAWRKQAAEVRAALEAAKDLPPALRERFADAKVYSDVLRPMQTADERNAAIDFSLARRKLDDFLSQFPEAADAEFCTDRYMGFFEKYHPVEASEKEWRSLAASPNRGAQRAAARKLAFLALGSEPLELRFVAVDGREVDLAKLRGKVVLIDFWATWCGSCKVELPDVVAAYRKYHDQGFEVIGITLESAKILAADTPVQQAGKLAAAKKVLTTFATNQHMPWPQYFDGKGWGNEFAKRFAVRGVPATFLVDRQGRLASISVHGKNLDTEVNRLLGL